jgi:hypothetical protein
MSTIYRPIVKTLTLRLKFETKAINESSGEQSSTTISSNTACGKLSMMDVRHRNV